MPIATVMVTVYQSLLLSLSYHCHKYCHYYVFIVRLFSYLGCTAAALLTSMRLGELPCYQASRCRARSSQ
jgi:hypothetical protein